MKIMPHRDLQELAGDENGATTLEWTLLLAAIALPSWLIIRIVLATLVAYYQMSVTLLGLPTP